MKFCTYCFCAVLLSIGTAENLRANNVQVANVSITDVNSTNHTAKVQFDLSWDNSWRTSSAPNNYDACWLFVKYSTNNGTTWLHASLSTSDGDHSTGTASPAMTINAGTSGKGVFVFRSADGTGSNTLTGMSLLWNFPAGLTSATAKVFAVEMVYVPTGPYYLGDGSPDSIAGQFHDAADTTSGLLVTSATSIMTLGGTTAENLGNHNRAGMSTRLDDFDNTVTQSLPSVFPNGYSAFYCMKYPITQQQYVDFLNTLTYAQQSTRTDNLPNSSAGTLAFFAHDTSGGGAPSLHRSGIRIKVSGSSPTPAVYGCDLNGNGTFYEAADGQSLVCNYLSWADGTAYSDWAGLRPMTELEYEKACRGPATPVANEFAWGTASIATSRYTLSAAGDSTEGIAANYSTTAGNAAFKLTAGTTDTLGAGPYRAGIYAANVGNSGRTTAGATYYGIMEMSGTVYNRCVSVGDSAGRKFAGTTGDGTLDSFGNATNINWPTTAALGTCYRGGSWNENLLRLRVSDRYWGSYYWDGRYNNQGFRAVR